MHYYDYFSIKEFLINRNMTTVPVHVVDKIERYHKPIINPIRHEMGVPIHVSGNSGYRSLQWEIASGRDGTSEHTFTGKGAVDYTSENIELLLDELRASDYMRICYYPDKKFIHCDHKGKEKLEFLSNGGGTWTLVARVKEVPLPQLNSKRVLSLRKIVPIIDLTVFIINKRPITMIWNWLKERFTEPSTYQGIVAIGSAIGVTLSPELWEAIASFAVGLIGLIQVIKKEKQNDPA